MRVAHGCPFFCAFFVMFLRIYIEKTDIGAETLENTPIVRGTKQKLMLTSEFYR